MSLIKIVTDSTCDLPQEIISEYDIRVIPCYVNMNGESYLDGVELSRQEFFRRLPDQDPIPTTSAPSPGSFIEAYHQLANEGVTGIISIHISQSLSNIVNVARMAAENFKDVPVKVIDSGQLSMGLGLLAIVGAQEAAKGNDLDSVAASILKKKPMTNAFAKLDTLEYLRRGGRLSNIQHSIVSLLDIKPITKMSNGISGMEMVRTRKKAYSRLIEIASDLGPAEMVGIIHADAPELADRVKQDLEKIWPGVVPLMNWVTPAIGAHVGPGTVCIASVQKNIERPLFDSRMDHLKHRIDSVKNYLPGLKKHDNSKENL